MKNYLQLILLSFSLALISCEEDTDNTPTTTTSSTATTATTSNTSSTATTSTTATTSSTSTTASTSTTSTTATTATTSTSSTTSTTGTSTGDFTWNGSPVGSMSISDCSFNSSSKELTITGTVSNSTYEYQIIAEFVLDSASASGNYITQYSGALTRGKCVIYIAQTRLSDNFTSDHKSQSAQNVTVTKIAENKFTMSFGTINFGVLPGGTAIRTASVTAFGCP